MKRILSVASALLFAACASETRPAIQTTASAPSRYATPEEAARLENEARANFERARQGQGQGKLLAIGSGPELARAEAPSVASPSAAPAVMARPREERHQWSIAEARYAMQIGKTPGELTPGERAVARGN